MIVAFTADKTFCKPVGNVLICILAILLTFGMPANAQTCTITASTDHVCLGNSVTLSIQMHPNDSAWIWDFGDGKTSTQGPSVTYQYSSAGNFTPHITLYSLGGGTCTSTKSIPISVVNKPTALFAITSSDSLCFKDNNLCIKDLSTHGNAPIFKRIVIFGDGGFDQSTDMSRDSICYSYSNPAGGKFNVLMQIFDTNGCENSFIDSVVVYPKILGLGFTVSYKSGCQSTSVNFKNTTAIPRDNVSSFLWNFADNDTSSASWDSVIHVYSSAGPFSPSLVVTDFNNCTDSFTYINAITNAIPDTTFSIISSGSSCVRSNYYTFSGAAQKVNWKVFDPSGALLVNTAHNPVGYIFPNCGRYKVRFELSTQACFYLKDTFIDIYGPNSVIQNSLVKVKNGIQCGVHDTVFFTNPLTDLNCYHQNGPMNRLWDFGDPFAPPCTTDTKNGLFVNTNCNFSKDSSLVNHLYKNGKDSCYKVKLFMSDPIRNCNDVDSTLLRLTAADAGWDSTAIPIRRGAYITGGPCLNQKISFHVDELLPKCGPEMVWFLPDSACFPHNWILKDTINKSAPFDYTYDKSCSPDGKVTYGVIVSNGLNASGARCYDTAWYRGKLFFQPFKNEFSLQSSPTNTCDQFIVEFTSNDSIQHGLTRALWTFGDSTTYNQYLTPTDSIVRAPTHQYNSAGQFRVLLTLYDKNNCPGTKSSDLFLGTYKNFSLNKTRICIGDSLMIKDTEGYYTSSGLLEQSGYWYDSNRTNNGKESILWDFGDGNGFVKQPKDPKVKYTIPGNYFVKMFVRDSLGCIDTLTSTDTIRAVQLIPKIGITQTEYLCSPVIIIAADSSRYIDSSAALNEQPYDQINQWEWGWGDDKAPSFLQNPAHFYTSNGQYTIRLKIQSDKGCVAYDSLPISIRGPQPRFVIVGDTSGCVPFTVTVKNTSSKSMINRLWYFNDTNVYSTQNDSNVSFTYNKPGIYHLKLVGEDTVWNNSTLSFKSCASTFPDPNVNTIIRDVKVVAPPEVNIITDTIVCQGGTLFMKNTSPSPYTKFTWEVGSGSPASKQYPDTNFSYLFNQNGTNTVKLTAYSFSPFVCADSTYKQIEVIDVKADFDIKFIPESKYEFTNKSEGATRYKWSFEDADGENSSTLESPSYDYQFSPGPHKVCLWSYNQYDCFDMVCKTTPLHTLVKIPNVITPNDDGKNDAFDIFIEGHNRYELNIYNRWGSSVFESNADGVGNDGSNWNGKLNNSGQDCPSGAYFYTFYYRFSNSGELHLVNGTITLIR
jgi:gliding motility-associated-like protein